MTDDVPLSDHELEEGPRDTGKKSGTYRTHVFVMAGQAVKHLGDFARSLPHIDHLMYQRRKIVVGGAQSAFVQCA